MCYLKPLKVIKIKRDRVILENNNQAVYDRKIGKIKEGDRVLVYGNLLLQKVNEKSKSA